MTVTINAVAATVADDIKGFRSAAVTSENKSNVAARAMLAALVAGQWTRALAESAIITAFGNPKSPRSNKPVTKLSGLRDFTGGDAVRKAAETVFRIFDNIDTDAFVAAPSDDMPEGVPGARAIRPLIVGYILSDADAPKSLRALNEAVNKAISAHAKAISPEAEAAEPNGGGEGEATPEAAPKQSLSDRILALMVAYEASTPAERVASHGDMEALFAMVNEDIAKVEGDGVTLEHENAAVALEPLAEAA